MKKMIILLPLVALMMVGCKDKTEDVEYKYIGKYRVEIIDSCEYISGRSRLAHKGNCKFCDERRKKEREEK